MDKMCNLVTVEEKIFGSIFFRVLDPLVCYVTNEIFYIEFFTELIYNYNVIT